MKNLHPPRQDHNSFNRLLRSWISLQPPFSLSPRSLPYCLNPPSPFPHRDQEIIPYSQENLMELHEHSLPHPSDPHLSQREWWNDTISWKTTQRKTWRIFQKVGLFLCVLTFICPKTTETQRIKIELSKRIFCIKREWFTVHPLCLNTNIGCYKAQSDRANDTDDYKLHGWLNRVI